MSNAIYDVRVSVRYLHLPITGNPPAGIRSSLGVKTLIWCPFSLCVTFVGSNGPLPLNGDGPCGKRSPNSKASLIPSQLGAGLGGSNLPAVAYGIPMNARWVSVTMPRIRPEVVPTTDSEWLVG